MSKEKNHCGHKLEIDGRAVEPSSLRYPSRRVALGKCLGNCAALGLMLVILSGDQVVAGEATSESGVCESSLSRHRNHVVEAMKKAFGDNEGQIAHAMRVLDCAERLLDVSKLEADRLTVIVAAILHDIGRCKKGTTDHEKDGAVVSREILANLGFTEEFTDHVSRIVGSHHSAKGIDTPAFRIVWIADRLVNRKRDQRNSEAINQEFAKESKVLDQKIKSNKSEARRRACLSPVESP
ncbi:MAG: HD domain-containing protein [Planctomycetota bacterium]